MNIKKIQKYILAFSSGIAVLSLFILLFLYFHGYNAWNPIVQWIMYFFVFGIGISCSTSIYLISSFFGELKEKNTKKSFLKISFSG